MTSVTVRTKKLVEGKELTEITGQLHGTAGYPGDSFSPSDFDLKSIHSVEVTPIDQVQQFAVDMAKGSVGKTGEPTLTLMGTPATVIDANFSIQGE